MKLLTPETSPAAATASTQAAPPRRPRLPRDAVVQFNNSPPAELYIALTITKVEHIEALMETLHTYAPQIEHARRRDEDR